MRIALGIEYNGSGYHGWQCQQAGVDTVQLRVEKALSAVAAHPVRVACAGRTDAGVHAVEQVVHFDTEACRSMRSWVFGANANLPADIAVRWAVNVSDTFHARFCATGRRYTYLIYNAYVRSALLTRQLTWRHGPMDVERMTAGAQHLIGTHDFSSYRAVHCQAKSPVRTVRSLSIERFGSLIRIDISADGFLHHMVRNIAGVLMAIGQGNHPPVWAKDVLEVKDRRQGGVTAPSDGLYFISASYDDEFGLPEPVGNIPFVGV